VRYVEIEDTLWPVDACDWDGSASAEWVLRYGTPEDRERQRLSVASVLSAYEYLTDPNRSMKDATASLRRARKATLEALLETSTRPVVQPEELK
jgi:hypothetical protein